MTENQSIVNPEEEDYNAWLEIASHDLGSAELLLRENSYADIIIYHCHQCIEKLLKAILIQNNIPFRKIHDLKVLLKQVLPVNQSLEEYKKDILFLNAYLMKARYPLGDNLTNEEARQCVAIARKIYEKIK
jgi:HEPN domain-containing protein